MLMYGIDVKKMPKLVQWVPRLQQVTVHKLRSAAADRMKQVVNQHDQRMNESIEEDIREGQYNVGM